MIFVAAGTTGFDALVKKMDELAPALHEPVTMQIGSGTFIPQRAEYFRFAVSLQPYYERASLVVAHGGMGTCLEVLRCNKPLIALANPDRYDQHQQDIISVLAEQNYLIWCKELNELAEALRRAQQQEFARYVAPECQIHIVIQKYLCNTMPTRARHSEKAGTREGNVPAK